MCQLIKPKLVEKASLINPQLVEKVLSHCKDYIENNHQALSDYEDIKEISERFSRKIEPYLNDNTLMIFKGGILIPVCSQTTVILTQLLGDCLSPKQAEEKITIFIEQYPVRRSTHRWNEKLKSLGTLFSVKHKVNVKSDFFYKQLGLCVLIKFYRDICQLTAEKCDHLFELFRKTELMKPSSITPEKNTKDRYELIADFSNFDLPQYSQTSASFNGFSSVESDTVSAGERLLNADYEQLFLLLQNDFMPPNINANLANTQQERSQYLLNRFELIFINRWIEIQFNELRMNQVGGSVNNKQMFLWLLKFFEPSDNYQGMVQEYSDDKLSSKNKYWGYTFHDDKFTPLLNESKQELALCTTLFFSEIKSKEFKNIIPKESEESKFIEMLKFLYFTMQNEVMIASEAFKQVQLKRHVLLTIVQLFNELGKWEKNDKHPIFSEWKSKQTKDFKIQLMQSGISELTKVLSSLERDHTNFTKNIRATIETYFEDTHLTPEVLVSFILSGKILDDDELEANRDEENQIINLNQQEHCQGLFSYKTFEHIMKENLQRKTNANIN